MASNLIGRNVTLDAGKSVSVTASNLAAVDNINLTARDGDVAVVDGENQSTSWYYKKQTGFGLGGGGSFTSFYGTEGKKGAKRGQHQQGLGTGRRTGHHAHGLTRRGHCGFQPQRGQ